MTERTNKMHTEREARINMMERERFVRMRAERTEALEQDEKLAAQSRQVKGES